MTSAPRKRKKALEKKKRNPKWWLTSPPRELLVSSFSSVHEGVLAALVNGLSAIFYSLEKKRILNIWIQHRLAGASFIYSNSIKEEVGALADGSSLNLLLVCCQFLFTVSVSDTERKKIQCTRNGTFCHFNNLFTDAGILFMLQFSRWQRCVFQPLELWPPACLTCLPVWNTLLPI